ncbi:hypothetical protein ACMFMG_007596 [Clarireedia jacksonii]
MSSPNPSQTRGQQFLGTQTTTPSRQGRPALAQSGSPQSPGSLASTPVRPARKPIAPPFPASTNPGVTPDSGIDLDKSPPSIQRDLWPVARPNIPEELLYHKPLEQQILAKSRSQYTSPTGRSSRSISFAPPASSTFATTSQRCVSAPSPDVYGKLPTSSEVLRPSWKRGRSQNQVAECSPLSAGNSMEGESPDSPSPRPRRRIKLVQGSSIDVEPAISSSNLALSYNRSTVSSDDNSSDKEEGSVLECLDDAFVTSSAVQRKDEKYEQVDPADSCPPLLEFENYREGGHRPLRETNEAIRDLIIKKSKSNKKCKGGFIYAMQCPDDASSHLKIGKSRTVPEKRFKVWSKGCRISLSAVPDPTPSSPSLSSKNAFQFFGLVESIIHQEFHNQRRQYVCKHHNKTKHKEWFDVSPETVYHSINRWRTWLVVEEPFDKATGKLKPYWQWKVDNLNKNYSALDWDIWTRRSYWDTWEYYLYNYSFLVLALKHLKRKDDNCEI